MHHGRCHIIFIIHTNLLFLKQCYFPSLDRGVTIRGVTTAIHIITLHCFLQRMQQEIQAKLSKVAAVASKAESEPCISTSTDPSGSSPPWVFRTHQQHAADYTRLMMQGNMDLTMGEDRAAPLITEEFSSMFISCTGL